jgi:site-specific recombinase XerD
MNKEVLMSTDSQERRSPRLLDQVRELIRIRHYSIRTEQAYVQWIRRFILFHDKRHPLELGAGEVTAFLSHLAVKRNVAASTQNQALNAILFLYRDVLKCTLRWLEGVQRAKKPQRLPVVLTRDEVRAGRGRQNAATDCNRLRPVIRKAAKKRGARHLLLHIGESFGAC